MAGHLCLVHFLPQVVDPVEAIGFWPEAFGRRRRVGQEKPPVREDEGLDPMAFAHVG